MKAMVTGSNGFIGSYLVEALLEKGYEVTCLIRKTSNLQWLKGLDVRFVVGDCVDKGSLYQAVKGVDYVYHLGAMIHAPDWQSYYNANTLGTENLVQVCCEINPQLKRFVFVSSISATGPNRERVMLNENTECKPVSDYGRSKLAAEEMLKPYRDKIPIAVVRPPNILGPRQKELYSVFKLVKWRIKPLLGNGDKQVSFCFVQDLVNAIILTGEKDEAVNQTYFVTDGNIYSWREVADLIGKILGVEPFVIPIPFPVLYLGAAVLELVSKIARIRPLADRRRIIDTRDRYWIYDSSKIRRELGFKPVIDFEQGMRDAIAWYKQQGLL